MIEEKYARIKLAAEKRLSEKFGTEMTVDFAISGPEADNMSEDEMVEMIVEVYSRVASGGFGIINDEPPHTGMEKRTLH